METAGFSETSTTQTVVTRYKHPGRRSVIYQLCNNCIETGKA